MRNLIDIIENALMESYMDTVIIYDYSGNEIELEVFENPTQTEISKILRTSEYASLRANFYPETDAIYVWVADRVQHHEVHEAMEMNGDYCHLHIDRTGVSKNYYDDEERNESEMDAIMASPAIKRAFGRNVEIEYYG